MIKWIHRLLEPHCPDCKAEREDNSICASCETLKMQLSIANSEKQQMMNTILELSRPQVQVQPVRIEIPESIKSKIVPWAVRRQMLEAEDRAKAKLMAEAALNRGPSGGLKAEVKEEEGPLSIEQLEQELGISEQKGAV